MNSQTLFLAWQDKDRSRAWFPVGRLDSDGDSGDFRFRYTGGANIAHHQAGFPALMDFPDFQKDYRSKELFPMFKNRVLMPGRPDFADYIARLGLAGKVDPMDMLSIDGGIRATDSFEVFPMIQTREDGSFRCRFFLHGWRHVSMEAQQRLERLVAGEPLTEDYQMIGWAPRFLLNDLRAAMARAPKYSAFVVRVNPVPAPSKQRVLIELNGHLPEGYKPMSGQEFQPLV
jgi:hypothetical protein